MKKILFTLCCLIFASSIYAQSTDNPLLVKSQLPFHAPRFDLITSQHFMPAYQEAIRVKAENIAKIVAIDPGDATFDNVIVPLEESGELLSSIQSIMGLYTSSLNNKEIASISKTIAPILSKFNDSIGFLPKMVTLITTLYQRRDSMGLDSVKVKCIESYYKNKVRSGAFCSDEQKQRLMEINSLMAVDRLKHAENIVAQTQDFRLIVGSVDSLVGIPKSKINSAHKLAKQMGLKDKWAFTLQYDYGTVMQSAKNRELRKRMYLANNNRCNNDDQFDNKAISVEIVNLRLEKAKILGFANYADYVLEDNMAKNSGSVHELLAAIATPAIAKSKEEMAVLQDYARETEGEDFMLQAWDWSYYSSLMKKNSYDLEGPSIREYFELNNVRDGAFYVAEKLYGIRFVERKDIPVWTPEVQVFQVIDADSSDLGLLYFDFYARQGKRGGAWCSRVRSSIDDPEQRLPLVTINCNITMPSAGGATLLSTSFVKTIFHEFGHALAGFFSAGTDRNKGGFPRDMVELPSQIMEHWAKEPEVLRVFAKHYRSAEVIPDSLISKMQSSELYNIGWSTAESIWAAMLDQQWHTQTEIQNFDVNKFEEEFRKDYGFITQVGPRYRTTFFNHIFASSYPAQYYVYTWASVLDTDAFAAFKETGDIFNPEVAAKFRKYILSGVGYDEPMQRYVQFRGSVPKVDALLKRKGFLPDDSSVL